MVMHLHHFGGMDDFQWKAAGVRVGREVRADVRLAPDEHDVMPVARRLDRSLNYHVGRMVAPHRIDGDSHASGDHLSPVILNEVKDQNHQVRITKPRPSDPSSLRSSG
jgi:hypothetical protein